MKITPTQTATTLSGSFSATFEMAETAEQAEMRALKEEVARLKKTRAAVVKALEAQSWDDVRAALAHSESTHECQYASRSFCVMSGRAGALGFFILMIMSSSKGFGNGMSSS